MEHSIIQKKRSSTEGGKSGHVLKIKEDAKCSKIQKERSSKEAARSGPTFKTKEDTKCSKIQKERSTKEAAKSGPTFKTNADTKCSKVQKERSSKEAAKSGPVHKIKESTSPKVVSGVNLTRNQYAKAIAAAQVPEIKQSKSPKADIYIDLTQGQESDTTSEEVIDLTTEPAAGRGAKEDFIDLTIESLRDCFEEIFIDLTDYEEIFIDLTDEIDDEPFIDLTIKEVKTDEWWLRRQDSLRKLKDENSYTEGCLEICWPYIRKTKRYKTAPKVGYPYIGLPAQKGKWLKRIAGYPDEALIKLDMHGFPVCPGHLENILSTLASFTSRMYLVVSRGKLCEDRQRAAFDTLIMPVFCEIVFSLFRYTSKFMCTIPLELFPDLELLRFSLLTLHRAHQFFQFILNKKDPVINVSRVHKDLINVSAMFRVINIFIAELVELSPKGEKRESDENDEEYNKKIKTDVDDKAKFVPCKVETNPATGVTIKPEIKDEPLEGFPAITEALSEQKVEVTVQLDTNQQAGETTCKEEKTTPPKSSNRAVTVVPIPRVKREAVESLMNSYVRSLSGYD